MARQVGWVQLEQSGMCLTRNMARLAKGELLGTKIEGIQYLIKRPLAEVQEEQKFGVVFPGHQPVKAVMEWPPAMVHEN